MTTPTTTYDQLAQKQNQLIRKALEGSVFIAPDSATLPAALTSGATSELLALPAGYTDVGWVSKSDGVTWPRSTETSNVESWGAVEPTRSDITKQTTGIKFVAQETKRMTLELYEGVDLAAVTPDATTGEVTFDRPSRPQIRYYRVLGLFVDGAGADTIYVGKLLPRANVTETGESKWADGDDPVGYDVTLSATFDADVRTSTRFFFGGPGWKALLADMGFTAA